MGIKLFASQRNIVLFIQIDRNTLNIVEFHAHECERRSFGTAEGREGILVS